MAEEEKKKKKLMTFHLISINSSDHFHMNKFLHSLASANFKTKVKIFIIFKLRKGLNDF